MACDCVISNFTQKFMRSDFVAEIKITKLYENEGSDEIYKSNIEILNLYKGDSLKSIYVAGRSDEKMGSSCAIKIPKETELIAYGYKNKDGKVVIGMCSGLTYTKKYYFINEEKITREKKMLSVLKKKNILLTNKVNVSNYSSLNQELEKFKGIELEKDFAIFEIKFSSDLKVKNVKTITGYEDSLNKKLMKILKNLEWQSYYNGERNIVPKSKKILFEINYYKDKKNNTSFLTQHLL
mgnify:CR=1 FL=1|tara:strand:- start:141 stop:854 length:714 start_codon:yes stop_codon:yes gene_type:complete